MRRRLVPLLAALFMAVTGTVTGAVAAAEPVATEPSVADVAPADACYTWNRTLREGMSGSDVTQLQIRVAGWVASGENLVLDGVFGPATKRAVTRFQSGYGLGADGIAGSQTYSKIYELQDNDCTPIHFAYSEFDDNCGANNFNGGKVSAATAKENIRRVMWQLEAVRRKLGDRPLNITSGFRSVSCNSSVGGSPSSLHMYGQAADLGLSNPPQCTMWNGGKTAGFEELLGPGYPGHNDHVHMANRSSRFWSAPNC
ncbi:M15 family metallopeptidase [Actinophytocola gossypii]|uniref:Peptidoglycan-binding protein n=1 Tax=Actinophytocola gossypii TaxID=2812003 RepID=A0ABT2JDN4_9PSEU|nr:M15 family metallopeptidase [Actinophytocola gossypii]MCT2585384.1 peptidoglycan-binding protein [Actinophytocola gossypii]